MHAAHHARTPTLNNRRSSALAAIAGRQAGPFDCTLSLDVIVFLFAFVSKKLRARCACVHPAAPEPRHSLALVMFVGSSGAGGVGQHGFAAGLHSYRPS